MFAEPAIRRNLYLGFHLAVVDDIQFLNLEAGRIKEDLLGIGQAGAVEKHGEGCATLADVFPERTKLVTRTAFSWMTTGGFGMGQPEMSPVAGIELAGREFMQGVFGLVPGQAGVAPNQAHSKVYVVRATSQEPDDERLRTQFAEMGQPLLCWRTAIGVRVYQTCGSSRITTT